MKWMSSITKKGKIESPSLVLDNWWNLYVRTFVMSEIQRYIGTHQMMELDDGHGDGSDQNMIFKCSNLEKKKEKNKMGSRQRYF